MNIVLAGLDGSGKTTLARLLVTGKITEHAPTERVRKDKLNWKGTNVIFTDSTGDAEVGRIWSELSCDAYVFIVDGADRERLAEVQKELKKLFSKKVPIALLLNKSDLVNFCPVPELVRLLGLEGEDPKSLPPMQAFECTIGKNLGYQEALDWLVTFAPDPM